MVGRLGVCVRQRLACFGVEPVLAVDAARDSVAIAFDLQHERRDFGADKQINLLAAAIEVAENDGRMFIDFENLDDSLKNASLGSILRAFGISTEDFNRHGLFVGPVVFTSAGY
ncbi:hypothetical protein WJ33_29280 [Burkholderia ubonensis]|uniref:Uncharacterized protein n=1 Tax=Burkholderia ubonensis TaxID=101571 RepID=A0A103R853_9BURK|nr:hypothetical protein WJ33_29280 [Burkholderia ubonensis]